ncbi:MAG: repeat, subgroup, partial [Chloroflexi bacterium]|nr:repeat, subgroup [Chloroflexota bacterium]
MSESLVKLAGKPYVGAYPIESGQPFFGRAAETADLISRLVARRIVLLHSPSGAGKTSLIQAGVVPGLQAQGFLVLPTMRVSRQVQPGQLAEGQVVSACLLSVLLSLDEGLPKDHQTPVVDLTKIHLLDYLETRREMFAQHCLIPAGRRTLLVFDQFEEVLTFGEIDSTKKQVFFDELMAVLYDNRYWVLFAIREDYLARLEPYLSFFPDRLSAHYPLEFLQPEAALEAVREPAKQFGVDFQEIAAQKLVDDLRQIRVQNASGEVDIQAGPYIEPVQLQVVCSNLWEADRPDSTLITLQDVEKWGSVQNALADYYADKVKKTAVETGQSERRIREWFGDQLISPGGLRIQVQAGREIEYGLTPDSVHILIDAWLVREESRRSTTWYELAHDRLIDPILTNNESWRLQNLSPLQRQAELWEREHRPDRLLLDEESLIKAEQWLDSYTGMLTTTEIDFRDKNRQMHQAQLDKLASERQVLQDRLKLENAHKNVWVLSVLLAVIAILTLLTGYYYRQAKIEASDTRHTLAVSYGVASEQSEKGIAQKLLTAVHALNITIDQNEPEAVAARQAVYDALRLVGGRRVEAPTGEDGLPLNLKMVALTPDGRWLASADNDMKINVWDLQASPPMTIPVTLGDFSEAISDLAFSPDGRKLAASSQDGSLRVWDTQAGIPFAEVIQASFQPTESNPIAFSPDGRWLAAGSAALRGQVEGEPALSVLIDLACVDQPEALDLNLPLQTQDGQDLLDTVNALSFSKDGRWLIAGGKSEISTTGESTPLLAAWDLSNSSVCQAILPTASIANFGREGSDPTMAETDITSLAAGVLEGFLTDTAPASLNIVVTVGSKNALHLWQLTPGGFINPPVLLTSLDNSVNTLAFDPKDKWLAAGSSNNLVYLWSTDDLGTGLAANGEGFITRELTGHSGAITSLAFSPDGRWLITGSTDQTLRLWNLLSSNPGQNPLVIMGHSADVNALAVSSEPAWLASASADGSLRLYNLTRPNPAALPLTFSLVTTDTLRAAINPNWVFLSPGTADIGYFYELSNEVEISQTSDAANPVLEFTGFSGVNRDLTGFVLSSDGDSLASSGTLSPDGTKPAVFRWTLDHATSTINAHAPVEIRERPANLAFSPDGSWLLAGGESGQMTLLDFYKDYPAPLSLRAGEVHLISYAFSPDNRWLVFGGMDGMIFAWDLKQMREVGASDGLDVIEPSQSISTNDSAPVCALAFRPPDGKSLAAGSALDEIYLLSPDDPNTEPVRIDAFSSLDPVGQTYEQFEQSWFGVAQTDKAGTATATDIITVADPCQGRPSQLEFSPDGRWLV